MDITKLSTKGQVVIPENIRKNYKSGTAFSVIKQGELIVFKPIKGLTKKELEEMQELDKIWKEIDAGKGKTMTVEEFTDEMKSW